MITKLIHFSDLHAGHKEINADDFKILMNNIAAEADENTLLVFTGDLFHKRVTVDSEANKLVLMLFNLIDQLGIEAIFLNGTRSHDYDYMDSYQSEEEDLASLFPTIRFISTKQSVKIQNLNILCLPEEYIDDEEMDNYYPELLNGGNGERYDITLFHGTISDIAHYNTGIETVPFKKAPSFTKKQMWLTSKIVLCGHIHERQEYYSKDNDYLCYVGSWGKMEHSTVEDNIKGYLHVYEISNSTGEYTVDKVKPIMNTATSQFYTYEVVNASDNKVIVKRFDDEKIYNLNNLDEISTLGKLCTDNTNMGIKFRFKVLNEAPEFVAEVLKKLVLDNPLAKVVFVKDVRKEKEIKEQEEILEDISNFKVLSSVEEQVQHFIKERLNGDVNLDEIKRVLEI